MNSNENLEALESKLKDIETSTRPATQNQVSSQTQTPAIPAVPVTNAMPNRGSNNLLWVLLSLLLLTVVGAGGYYLWTQKGRALEVSSPTPSVVSSQTPDPTANWKTYRGETIYSQDDSTLFEIKYPSHWLLKERMLYPFGEPSDKSLATVVVLGAGGHGWAGEIEKKTFPAGEARYSWVKVDNSIAAFASFDKNNHVYIIEIQNLPLNKEAEFKLLFDQMISTFKFLDSSPYSCPEGEWVDCMPKVDASPVPQCSQEYLTWASKNCPNFKGAAY